ncbi:MULTISPECIES: SDR family NAD(P)-dependent oxidoreductase [unclassified Streptomyces]|uniref:SDR family NAD(P)-dependent oxidoreductase n=1 Tax=unclassified Streptomyces TaxID=2593676 RepID=UPI000DBA92E4|nr:MULTISPECIES: SDR family NAD(P)-dependent oxidoreductase [unclassified Streptomyces]MYT68190.1 SDR family NAD(P)-dependent oxidoreductase [Streptomyces sp. SID8367]RAJ72761.1 short-subunit dehydrogenase [Streptomyces sp. PsTaAH-137]
MTRRSRLTLRSTGPGAVVTGGSRGLGLFIARYLAERGCVVTIAARDEKELERAAAQLREETGATIHVAVCDVRDRATVRELMRSVHERDGLDVVIANAGVIQVAPVEALGAEEFTAAMDTMFNGTLHTALEALPHLRETRGRLGLIGSVGGLLGVPHLLPYSCAKAAVGALAEGLHAEAAPAGVSVTAVHPGLMRTGSHLQAEFGGDTEAEFGWFSAAAGTPVLSMDAERAARRIVDAVIQRRTRLVLTAPAKAAQLAHGIAPALTTRLTGATARLLPTGHGKTPLVQGHEAKPPGNPLARRIRAWGSALNDRAVRKANQERPGPRTAS